MSADLDRIAVALERAAEAAELSALAARPAVGAADAGRLLGCSGEHVRDLVARGHLTRVPNTSRFLVAVAELHRFAREEGLPIKAVAA